MKIFQQRKFPDLPYYDSFALLYGYQLHHCWEYNSTDFTPVEEGCIDIKVKRFEVDLYLLFDPSLMVLRNGSFTCHGLQLLWLTSKFTFLGRRLSCFISYRGCVLRHHLHTLPNKTALHHCSIYNVDVISLEPGMGKVGHIKQLIIVTVGILAVQTRSYA